MKIYLASGYSVMNCKGRERELADRFKTWRRLISYHDKSRGNKIEWVLELKQTK
jgi:hypothetical protein